MTDLELKIQEYGLTPEQYELCLSDAYQKANHIIALDWQEIIDIWYYYPDPRAYRVDFYKHGAEYSNFVLSLITSFNNPL